MVVCLVTGLSCWSAWIGFRQSDDKTLTLIAIMGFAMGTFLIFVAFVNTLVVIGHSAYCIFRYKFGLPVLLLAILILPLFALPFCFY